MIVRILGEAQYEVPDDEQGTLDQLDAAVVKAVDAGDEAAFSSALKALAARSARSGQLLADDSFVPSDLVVPFADAVVGARPAGCWPTPAPTRVDRHAVSTARNIPSDRGLTLRMFTTGLMLVVLYGAVVGILIAVGISYAVVLVFAAALLFAQYWFSDKIALFGMGGHIVTPEQEPQLHGAIDRLCALADMKKPRVAIADTDMPNAFATGRSPNTAVVCATRGLMRRLDEPELEAVLAHELSHVAHRDVAVMTIASFLGMIAGLVTRIMLWTGMMGGFGGGTGWGGNNSGGDQAAMVEMAVLRGLGGRLRHQLPPHHGPVALPGAGRRPFGCHPDRSAVGAGLGPGEGDRGHRPHPHPGPAVGRELQRLLLHPGHRQERGQPLHHLLDPPVARPAAGPAGPPGGRAGPVVAPAA